MFSLRSSTSPPRRLAALALAAAFFAPAAALAATAANTVITNTASVSFSDAGGTAQTPVTASAAVTVTLVPSAVALTSPANQTINQSQSASLVYTITSTANGQDTYNLSSVVTPSNMSTVTGSFASTSIVLGGTTLAADAVAGAMSITVPYDNVAGSSVNGITVSDLIVVGGNQYTVSSVTKNAGANTATIGLSSAITGATVTAGQIVGERQTFTETVPSGLVTSGTSGTQTVNTTAVSATLGTATTTQGTPTVITVNKPSLTVSKVVSVDGGATFAATGNAPPSTSLVYKIVISNTGASSATSVTITDALPAYLTYVTNSGRTATASGTAFSAATPVADGASGYAYNSGTRTVTYSPGSALAGGAELVLFFRATVN